MRVGRDHVGKEGGIGEVAGVGGAIGATIVHPDHKVVAGYVSVECLVHGLHSE